MKPGKIFLTAVPAEFRETASVAAQTAFPQAELVETGNWTETIAKIPSGETPLVIAGPSDSVIDASITDANGLASWPVVQLGDSTTDWKVAPLTRTLLDAAALHTLRLENARLSGDLKTIARRIAHDLRSPVGSIHTSADVLTEISPDDAATVASMAEIVKQSSGEISRIIDRVSFVTWASVQTTPIVKLDLGDVISHVIQQLEEDIETARATITLPPTWPEAKGVASWTQAIWTNYLSNALKFAGPAPKVTITWTPTAQGFRFTLSDRGPGVGSSRLASLFTPFDRLHTGRVQGLGLPIVERLTKLQGGYCGYEPAPEGGSNFYFTLPAAS